MKKCSACGKIKPVKKFFKKYGNAKSQCKDCEKSYMKIWRAENVERLKEYGKEKGKIYYQENKEEIKASVRKYASENVEKVRATSKAYRAKNKDKARKAHTAWREKNRDRVRAKGRAWKKNNPHKVLADKRRRQATKQKRTPVWSIQKIIEIFYFVSNRLTKIMDDNYHVDHILPLKGKEVSGLHVHTNLQVIGASKNLKKSNKTTLNDYTNLT